jgi:hypothetical protein
LSYQALVRASWTRDAQVLELLTECFAEDPSYWLQWNTEKGKRFVLDGRRSGWHGERIVRCDSGDDGIAGQCRKIGEQRVEAVHRQSLGGQAGGLLGDSGL